MSLLQGSDLQCPCRKVTAPCLRILPGEAGRASRNSAPHHSPGLGGQSRLGAQVPRGLRDSKRFPKPPAPAARTEAPSTGSTAGTRRDCAEQFSEARGAGRCHGSWRTPSQTGGSGLPARELQQVPDTRASPLWPEPSGQAGLTGHTTHTGPGLPAKVLRLGRPARMPEAPAPLPPAA